MLITENVPLAPLTTLKVGGAARYLIDAVTISEVSEAVEFSRSRSLPLFVLGGGSNVVISDAGWLGVVLKIGITRSVGGTPVQNVGAYGQEVASTIESVLALDLRDGQLHELCSQACGFS